MYRESYLWNDVVYEWADGILQFSPYLPCGSRVDSLNILNFVSSDGFWAKLLQGGPREGIDKEEDIRRFTKQDMEEPQEW